MAASQPPAMPLSNPAEEDAKNSRPSSPSKSIENPQRLEEEYESLFNKRPSGLGRITAWLLRLGETREQEWYESFFRWYQHKLDHPQRKKFDHPQRKKLSLDFLTALVQESELLGDISLKDLADIVTQHKATKINIGKYFHRSLWLHVHGSALDPPTVQINTFRLLGVQYAHLDMFAGLRCKEKSKDDVCVLTLGNIYASDFNSKDPDRDSFDTRYVLALDTALTPQLKLYLIYKYEVYETEYLDDGGEKRDEEPEQKEPPRVCDGPHAFTIAEAQHLNWEYVRDTMERYGTMDMGTGNILLNVVSTKKPSLAVAGYKDADHPYVPVFSPRDS